MVIATLTAKRDTVLLRRTARSPARQGALSGLLVCRIASGQIAETWTHWDYVDIMERFGLRPAYRRPKAATFYIRMEV
ncbi:MAG: hypothetical protein HGA65_13925 [Oscillochloris sp.]|nr:hypothetical protein [Oscillochloris sp.]